MRIAMFTNNFLPLVGGIENSVSTFCIELRALGHKTLVVTPKVHGATESDDLTFRVPALRRFYGSEFSLSLPFAPGLPDRPGAS